MRLCRACLIALLLAFGIALGHTVAYADGLGDALTHFTADDFDETSAGIAAGVFLVSRCETRISDMQAPRWIAAHQTRLRMYSSRLHHLSMTSMTADSSY